MNEVEDDWECEVSGKGGSTSFVSCPEITFTCSEDGDDDDNDDDNAVPIPPFITATLNKGIVTINHDSNRYEKIASTEGNNGIIFINQYEFLTSSRTEDVVLRFDVNGTLVGVFVDDVRRPRGLLLLDDGDTVAVAAYDGIYFYDVETGRTSDDYAMIEYDGPNYLLQVGVELFFSDDSGRVYKSCLSTVDCETEAVVELGSGVLKGSFVNSEKNK